MAPYLGQALNDLDGHVFPYFFQGITSQAPQACAHILYASDVQVSM